jgi:hypothetical protein
MVAGGIGENRDKWEMDEPLIWGEVGSFFLAGGIYIFG